MNTKQWTIGLLLLVTLFTSVLAACGSSRTIDKTQSDNKPVPVAIENPFTVLQAETANYLKRNLPLYIEPAEVMNRVVIKKEPDYVVVDIRNDEHYAAAHIPGAIHIAYADIWREQKFSYLPKDKKLIVVDYSGHTASQTAALWNMLGLDAVAMKNGMAGWSKDKEVIGGSPLLCAANSYPVTSVPASSDRHDLPKLDLKAASVAEILMKTSQLAAEIPPVILPKDLMEKVSSHYIIDLRQPQHYQAGHIEGAVNIPFRDLAETESLRKIPLDKNIALVCYDGHAASQAARLLNLLGYRTAALKDGMSAWTANEGVIGAKAVSCRITENPVEKLNALLKAGPSTAAT